MPHDPDSILQILDSCCGSFTFPMLDNGYVYLAASRLSLHHSADDWAMVIEVFGFSPRSGLPDLHIHTFGSRLHNRNSAHTYATPAAHQSYLARNPHNESRFFHPVEEGDWMDAQNPELVSTSGIVTLRGSPVRLPLADRYGEAGIALEGNQPAVFELCRFLAFHHRDDVLATPVERRVSVPPELQEILVLEDWHHPDVCSGELPGATKTFQALAEVLATGDLSRYQTSEPPNTHWSHWPHGGTL